MKKVIIAILVKLAVITSTAFAHTQVEEALYIQLTNEVTSVSVPALDEVLKTSEGWSADILYVACDVAIGEKRLEDAGFLFFVARIRARFDEKLFPPIETGGNSPLLIYAEWQVKFGEYINPEITSQPKLYAKVLERVKSWKLKVTADYTPWWEYSKKGTEKEAEESSANSQKILVDHMTGFCTLLQDPEYFAAYTTMKNFNRKFPNDNTRPSKEAYDAAVLTAKRIEKKKGIEAISKVIKDDNAQPDAKLSKPITH